VQHLASCAESAVTSFTTSIKSIAEAIVGGVAGAYLTQGAISAILSSAKGFLAGTVSALGLWDVLIAAASVVTLADLLTAVGLTAIGVTVSVGLLLEVAFCLFTGS
jgi:hypothetical protein